MLDLVVLLVTTRRKLDGFQTICKDETAFFFSGKVVLISKQGISFDVDSS